MWSFDFMGQSGGKLVNGMCEQLEPVMVGELILQSDDEDDDEN